MAADIKNYLKEKEKRQNSQDDYKKKIRKHRLKIVYGFGSGTCSCGGTGKETYLYGI